MGLILPRENIIFIHIPKTGGQSICKAFEQWYDKPSYWDYYNNLELETAHFTASEIKEKVGGFFNRAFKFTVKRKEHDRLVSFYHYGLRKLKPSPFKDFNHFIDYVIGNCEVELTDTNQRWSLARLNSNHWIDIKMDYVIDFDNIKEDWKVIEEHVGETIKLPFINKSIHKDYKSYYTRHTFKSIEIWSQ